MARKLKMSVSVVNLRVHPHSPEIYENLFRFVYRLRKPAKVHGDRNGVISSASFRDVENGTISGVITTFTDLPDDGAWFDTEELDDASEEKLAEISIPPGLFPNSATYFFRFTIPDHRLYVEAYSRGKAFTPRSILNFVRNLFGDPSVIVLFGAPSVSLVQDKDGMEKLFAIDRIKKIEITIEKPNADILADDFEEEVEKHLRESRTQKMTLVYEAEQGQSIIPTKDIRRAGEVALTNGEIHVSGRNDGMAFNASTSDYPKVLQSKYDPELTSEQQEFNNLVNNQEA